VELLLKHGATVIVLSRGFQERLRVAPETRLMLEDKGIPTHVAKTEEAAEIYDKLRTTEKVGALFHSTC
jgi:hypothetical protein